MEFKEELKKYQKQVEKELEKYVRKDLVPEKVLNGGRKKAKTNSCNSFL